MHRSLSRCLVFLGIVLPLAGRDITAAEPERPKKSASIAELVQELKDGDYSTRFRAAGELEKLGREAEPATPALIDALGDDGAFNTSNSDLVPWMAKRTFLTIGPPAIPALTAAVKNHENKQVRNYAMLALAEMGSDAYPAIPVLQAAMRRDSDRVRAAFTLWRMDPNDEWVVPAVARGTSRPLDVLLHCLRHNDPEVRIAAVRVLAEIGPAAKEAVPLLAKAIEDADYNVRWSAVHALGAMKQEARPAVPTLRKALDAKEAYLRYAAADALARIRPRSKDVAAALTERLKDMGAKVPEAAAQALGAMGEDAEAAVPALMEALKNPAAASDAAAALGAIGPSAKAAVPALRQAMKDPDTKYISTLRREATKAVGGIGPEARAAIPDLIDAFADKWYEVPPAAVESLLRIGPAAVPALGEALKDERPIVLVLAARTLARFGAAAKPAVPALEEALKNRRGRDRVEALTPSGSGSSASTVKVQSGLDRVEAAFALWRIDPHSKAVLPVLMEVLKAGNWGESCYRASEALHTMEAATKPALPILLALVKEDRDPATRYALHVLRGMGPAGKAAVPALVEALKKKSAFRAEIAWTLGKLGGDAEPAVPALIAALGDADLTVRWAVLGALGRLESAARPAVPILIRALRDPERSVRASAAFALGQIGSAARPAVLPLAALLQDGEPVVRWAALTALEALGPTAQDAAAALGRLARDRRGFIPVERNDLPHHLRPKRSEVWHWPQGDRYADMEPAHLAYQAEHLITVPERAIRILAALGPAAREAVPALLAARHDDRVTVRRAADAALKKIDPTALDKVQPARKEMEQLWGDLASDNEETAYPTLWTLILAPRAALPWLRERLHPIAPVPPERIAQLIRDLDDETFSVRAKATKELEDLGELTEPALRAVLQGKPSLEARRRVEQLLKRLDEQMPTPEGLRTLRAIAVLEKIGTPEARELLQSLAKGATGASPTREANAALHRLGRGTIPTSP